MQPKLFETKTAGNGGNPFKEALEAFYAALADQRPLTIVETAQKTMLLQLADPIGEHLQGGRLSVADQKALEMINQIIGDTDLATGKDKEIDALTETMRALTRQALEPEGTNTSD